MKYYFEVEGLAVDKNNNPCLVGVVLKLHDFITIHDEDMPDTVERVAKALSVDKTAVRHISKAEYDEKSYGKDWAHLLWHN